MSPNKKTYVDYTLLRKQVVVRMTKPALALKKFILLWMIFSFTFLKVPSMAPKYN